MQPNWDDLRVFLTLARNDSLSRAGKQLRLDPATVGRRIARLETSYGASLFVKSPTGYALTEMGERLLQHAERAEQSMQLAEEAMSGQEEGLRGQIRIGAPDGAANFVLPQVCAEIARANPDLEIQIVALPRLFSLSKREADFAVAVSPPQTGRLMVQKITDYRLSIAAADSYLARHDPITTVEQLRPHRIIGYIPDMIYSKEVDYLGEIGIEAPQLASNSVSVQAHWIRQGAGIGIVHDFSLPALPGVSRVLPKRFSLLRSFYLLRHEDDKRLERHNRFAAALTEGMRKEVQRLEALS
ncbi:LysR family transcriptional regulator [Cognatishimia maritima]|uniref:LysR family transcriptional regulator n=1 Tax=Cognatishimia maritima TaxID=870908 RepID=UPI00093429A6|nr:LysR family transcriptional regulator [Cognatishimia maritima]